MEATYECIEFLRKNYNGTNEIIWNEKFNDLHNYPRHFFTDTYNHSIRVAVGAAILAKMMGANIESAIRVGLLHDMCFVNYHVKNDHKGLYAFYHPIEAAENADKEFGLTREEVKAIHAHMFPLAVHIPSSRVALALTISDKCIAIYEGLYGIKLLREWMVRFGMRKIMTYS